MLGRHISHQRFATIGTEERKKEAKTAADRADAWPWSRRLGGIGTWSDGAGRPPRLATLSSSSTAAHLDLGVNRPTS